MKTRVSGILVLTVALAASPVFAASTDFESERQQLDTMADETLQQFFSEQPNGRERFNAAYGYAVFQSINVIIGISGGGGKGVAVNKETGNRTYMKMASGGIGLGLGGQKSRHLMLFRDAQAFDDFITNRWEGNAGASAVAGTEGLNSEISFEQAVEVYQFTRSGLLATADVSGTRFWHYDKLNAELSPETIARAETERRERSTQVADARRYDDSDGDGIVDSADECPGTPRGAAVDSRGCWDIGSLTFESARSQVEPGAEPLLDEVAQVLRDNPDLRLRIEGHTDAAGTDQFNMQLSELRAEAVKEQLVQRGIAPDRLQARGYGSSLPIAPADAQGHAQKNRRVELTPIATTAVARGD